MTKRREGGRNIKEETERRREEHEIRNQATAPTCNGLHFLLDCFFIHGLLPFFGEGLGRWGSCKGVRESR
jgi:hypothetical protein